MVKHALACALISFISCSILGQQPASKPAEAAGAEVASTAGADLDAIPEKRLNFSLLSKAAKVPTSPVTSVPLCDSDGYLLIDMLNPNDMTQHSLVAMSGEKSQSYLPSAISDLRDILVRGFYSSGSTVAFLVRGARQSQGSQAASKSPAGYDWSSYHEYLAKFKRDGTFEESLELDTKDDISHVALFRSGNILALGYDRLNSTLHLLLFDSTGKVIRTLELPAGRRSADGGADFRSPGAMMASAALAGSVVFTPYRDDILVWRRNSNDAIVEVQSGGGTREIPLQIPKGFIFVQMIPATDWWVANFRRTDAPEHAHFGPENYAYFELRPQDASLAAKLTISQGSPSFLACEVDGDYITYGAGKDDNIQIYHSK